MGFADSVNEPKPGRQRFNSKHGRRPPVVHWTRRRTATRIDIDALPIGSSELELAGLKLSAPGTSRWIGRSVGNAAEPGFAAYVTIACIVRLRCISSGVRGAFTGVSDDPTIASRRQAMILLNSSLLEVGFWLRIRHLSAEVLNSRP
jgi:hypothetical protein